MWSHYAGAHTGAVLKFNLDATCDSPFLASKPVQYSLKRPLMYRTPDDLIRHCYSLSIEESAGALISDIVFTKSQDWAYEQEYRLAIPDFIPAEASHQALRFRRHELSAVYFGCRISAQDREVLIALAKRLNPTIALFQAETVKREYMLQFKRL